MSHAIIASITDGIRSEFMRAHPALPDKVWLRDEVAKLEEAVDHLFEPADVAGAAAAANAAQNAEQPPLTDAERIQPAGAGNVPTF